MKWLRFIPHWCNTTWDFEKNQWKPCPRCGLVRFLNA